ncbi:hypothetical protein KHA80_22540 [Anaerobacillus sp. HL2]|nr:hypothetical protein KHA80_22540 [Anaerobacillus sp. HL2]
MARIDFVKDFSDNASQKYAAYRYIFKSVNKLMYQLLYCSSNFTDNYNDLLVAVNIGGTGTLVASLASLITYRIYIYLIKKGTLLVYLL